MRGFDVGFRGWQLSIGTFDSRFRVWRLNIGGLGQGGRRFRIQEKLQDLGLGLVHERTAGL